LGEAGKKRGEEAEIICRFIDSLIFREVGQPLWENNNNEKSLFSRECDRAYSTTTRKKITVRQT